MPKRKITGEVVSAKTPKTLIVRAERVKEHPKYKKRFKFHKRYKAHDQKQQCKQGDTVVIEECRPLSKDKRWRVVEVLSKKEEQI